MKATEPKADRQVTTVTEDPKMSQDWYPGKEVCLDAICDGDILKKGKRRVSCLVNTALKSEAWNFKL